MAQGKSMGSSGFKHAQRALPPQSDWGPPVGGGETVARDLEETFERASETPTPYFSLAQSESLP